jgi:exopolysaccharide biosynthesis polyprenyl glycosylphosphotransferase
MGARQGHEATAGPQSSRTQEGPAEERLPQAPMSQSGVTADILGPSEEHLSDDADPDDLVPEIRTDAFEQDVEQEVASARTSPPLRRILAVVDGIAIGIGWVVAFAVGFFLGEPRFGPVTAGAQTVLMLGAGALLLSANGLYRRRICAIRSAEIARVGLTSLGLAVGTVVVLASVGREAAVLAGFAGGVTWFTLLNMERGLLREWIHGRRASGDFGAPVLVIGGSASSTLSTATFLDEHPVLGFAVRGVACPSPAARDGDRFPWVDAGEDLLAQANELDVSGVVIDAGSMTGEQISEVVRQLSSTALHVHINSGLSGVDSRRITVSAMADETFLHVAPLGLSRRQVVAKRFVDVTLGSLALALLSPILAVSALLVWAYDRGPIFYRQERVGLNGERFMLFKLRSMVVDADAKLAELQAENSRSGPLFKMANDPRITPFGRFLRSSSIDEIPQLFNVLEGTMSLVGPRPALPAEVAQFDDRLNQRLTVKPGVTGLWQVEARDLSSFDLYRRYDLLYVQSWSLPLDLAIIARTAVVVGMRGIRSLVPARVRRGSATVLE